MRHWLMLAVLGVVACGRGTPRPIAYGAEPCAHCHMSIADPRFVAEAVMTTGKVVAFDDIGCLASWLRAEERQVTALWVASFTSGEWLAAEQAAFLRTDSLRTPMASGLIAARTAVEADSLGVAFGGTPLSWSEIAGMPPPHGTPRTP